MQCVFLLDIFFLFLNQQWCRCQTSPTVSETLKHYSCLPLFAALSVDNSFKFSISAWEAALLFCFHYLFLIHPLS